MACAKEKVSSSRNFFLHAAIIFFDVFYVALAAGWLLQFMQQLFRADVGEAAHDAQ